MYADKRVFWLAVAILGSLSVAEKMAEKKLGGEEPPWQVAEVRSVTLEPFGCQNFEFALPAKSVGRLSFSDLDLMEDCHPEATLWMTSELYHAGYCFDWDYRADKCLTPDTEGLLFKEEMCNNWDFLLQTYFQPSLNVTTDYDCMKERTYFFAMRSSCYWPIKVNLQMETRNLTMRQDAVCSAMAGVLGMSVFQFLNVILVVALGVLLAGMLLCCCCCCPCCLLFKRAAMARAGYRPIPDDGSLDGGSPTSPGSSTSSSA